MTTEGSAKLWNWAFSKLPLAIGSFRCTRALQPRKLACTVERSLPSFGNQKIPKLDQHRERPLRRTRRNFPAHDDRPVTLHRRSRSGSEASLILPVRSVVEGRQIVGLHFQGRSSSSPIVKISPSNSLTTLNYFDTLRASIPKKP